MKQCLIIRCTNKNQREIDLKSTIANVINSENIFFVIDNEINENNSTFNLKKFREENNLNYKDPRIGWRCGDFSYYCAFSKKSNYDFYWMIEPDVFINSKNFKNLIEKYINNKSDLIGYA